MQTRKGTEKPARGLNVLVLTVVACGGGSPTFVGPPLPGPPVARTIPVPVTHDVPTVVIDAAACRVAVTPPENPLDRRHAKIGFGTKRKSDPTSDDPALARCEVADSNIAVAIDKILALPPPQAGAARANWDHRSKPARLDLVAQRFLLNAEERRRLYRDGFVVSPRFEQPSYGWAYHEIYQSQLPVFVTVDSILNSVYAAHDGLVSKVESRELSPLLTTMLSLLHCKLPEVAARYPAEVAKDLDLYLVVARSLLGETKIASALRDAGVESAAKRLVDNALAAGPMRVESLFGRDRVIDWSQYQPRGHYSRDGLEAYFRAVMWLSRIEFNIVSRSSRSSAPGDRPDPTETPRETVVALALADLVAASGQSDALARFETVFGALAGSREDIPLPALAKLAGVTDLKSPDAAAQVRKAVGNSYQRKARLHYMPEGSTTLPAIASFIGPRVVADTIALRQLAHSEVPGRDRVRAGDIAFLLGHERGKQYLRDDLAKFPSLGKQLEQARTELAAAPRGDDLYTAWLDAVRAIAVVPKGTLPSFADTNAYRDMKLSSAIAGFAQIRHNHVLIAGQAYGEGGCRIPDGYVEPAPDVYAALAAYAELGVRRMEVLGDNAKPERDYFLRLEKIARVLVVISKYELANQPLPPVAQHFLGMVSEMLPFGSDGRPTYTGWYFDLFADRADAIANPALVADYFTSMAGVSYVGVEPPAMGIFVVDTGGKPRTFVGPVARTYEYQGPQSPRLDDRAARKLDDKAKHAPWVASFAVAKPPEPSFTATFETEWSDTHTNEKIVVEAPAAIGPMTIELRDHHRVTLAKVTRSIGKGKTVFVFPKRKIPQPTEDGSIDDSTPTTEFVVFTTAKFFGERELSCMDGCLPMSFGSMREEEAAGDE